MTYSFRKLIVLSFIFIDIKSELMDLLSNERWIASAKILATDMTSIFDDDCFN